MIKCITLAKLNIKNHPKQKRIFSVILVVSMVMFLIASTLSEGFVKISQCYRTDDVSLREIQVWPSDDPAAFDNSTVLKLSSMEHIVGASQRINAFLSQSYTIEIDGTMLQCIPELCGQNHSLSFAPRTAVAEIQNDENASPILYGRDFKSTDSRKAIIDENTCYILGYSDLNKIIGKTIDINLSDTSVKDVEIVGVCLAEYGFYDADLTNIDDYSRNAFLQSELCNPVFFSDDIILELSNTSNDIVDWYYENLRLIADNTDHVKEISDKALALFGYDSSNMIATIERKAANVESFSTFIYVISGIILLAASVIVMNTLVVQIIHQRKYTDMILKIGYQKKHIILIYVIENTIVFFRAMIISLATSLGASLVIDMVLSMLYREVSSIKRFAFLLDVPNALLLSCGVFVFILLLTYIATSYQFNRIRKDRY